MKKLLCMIMALGLMMGCASASILEADHPMLDHGDMYGIQAQRGVVLCRSLSVHKEPNARSKKITTLTAGDTFYTWKSENGWYNCYYNEKKDVAWVRSAYVALDPMYYVTDDQAPVYAYGSRNAPRVGLLDDGEHLPILLETDDYCVVSLRGASGWIEKTKNDAVHQSWFSPELLAEAFRADLLWQGRWYSMTDEKRLEQLGELLADGYSEGKWAVNGSFDRSYLKLTFSDGHYIKLALLDSATAVYRVDGCDYRYAITQGGSSQTLRNLFAATAP